MKNNVLENSIGKTIEDINLGSDDALRFKFTDGSMIKIFDNGQNCCEKRYMRTDDDLKVFVGSKFLGMELKNAGESIGEDGDYHQIQFLEIQTGKGVFTMSSHNEHNGYYRGFSIEVELEP